MNDLGVRAVPMNMSGYLTVPIALQQTKTVILSFDSFFLLAVGLKSRIFWRHEIKKPELIGIKYINRVIRSYFCMKRRKNTFDCFIVHIITFSICLETFKAPYCFETADLPIAELQRYFVLNKHVLIGFVAESNCQLKCLSWFNISKIHP